MRKVVMLILMLMVCSVLAVPAFAQGGEAAAHSGTNWVALTSGFAMAFAVAELPYVTLWKNLTALEEGYVTGLEPGTGFPYTRRLEREAGRVPKLKPGETRHFAIDFGVHTTAAAVARLEEQIKRIQDGRSTQIDRAPER